MGKYRKREMRDESPFSAVVPPLGGTAIAAGAVAATSASTTGVMATHDQRAYRVKQQIHISQWARLAATTFKAADGYIKARNNTGRHGRKTSFSTKKKQRGSQPSRQPASGGKSKQKGEEKKRERGK